METLVSTEETDFLELKDFQAGQDQEVLRVFKETQETLDFLDSQAGQVCKVWKESKEIRAKEEFCSVLI